MFKVTRFCVLAYERRCGRLVRGEVRQFHSRDEAVRVAAMMRKRVERVDVLEVQGWPVQDLWDRPRLVG
jgi:hypothetical protein